MWFGVPCRRNDHAMSVENEEFHIIAWHGAETGDVWSFNPVAMIGGLDNTVPSVFEVLPNYPNPFNAGTTIKYALPYDSRVTLRVYNILGQQVRLVEDGTELEGYRTVHWDGRNDRGVPLGSGVYIYRLEATTSGENPQTLARTGKMVMVK